MAHLDYENGYYDGDVNYNDEEHGYGIFVWNNGDKYVGEWRNGEKHGHGISYYSDGDKYDGEWRDDQKHGHGIFYYSDGDKYDGEWRDDQKHGHGVYYYSNGDRYDGEFRNGDFNGHGVYHYSNGDRYDGEWRDDKKYGHGKQTYSWGYYEGQWRNGDWGGGRGIEAHVNSDGVVFEGNFIDHENATDVTCTQNGKKSHGKIVDGSFEEDEDDNIITYEGRRYVEIDGYYFGEEAMARMQPSGNHGASIHYNGWAGRSIFPQFVIEAITYSISNGLTELQENGRNRHYCGSISVITTTDNRHVITVFDNPNQNK